MYVMMNVAGSRAVEHACSDEKGRKRGIARLSGKIGGNSSNWGLDKRRKLGYNLT
jgi:hypothetical protein